MKEHNYEQYIHEMVERFGFDRLLSDVSSLRAWLDVHANDVESEGYFYNYGASRVVFGNYDWDFVFKIVYDLSDEMDYCANEAFIYKKAVERGLGECFASCIHVGNFFGVDVYAMERCVCDEQQLSDDSYALQFKKFCEEEGYNPDDDEAQEAFDSYDGYCEDQEAMLELAGENWGHTIMREVENFFCEYGVNDCHCGNWGYVGSRMVVVDYAGYGSGAETIARLRGKEEE